MPNNENSKNPSFSPVYLAAILLTNKLVEVPIKVQLPPKILAKEIGNKSLPGGN